MATASGDSAATSGLRFGAYLNRQQIGRSMCVWLRFDARYDAMSDADVVATSRIANDITRVLHWHEAPFHVDAR